MTRLKIAVICLTLSVMACDIQTKLPAPTPQPKKLEYLSSPPTGRALGDVEIRNTPEANGDPSWNVGYLANGDEVTQRECVTVGNAVWVRHESGWSVVRNSSGVYIVGIC